MHATGGKGRTGSTEEYPAEGLHAVVIIVSLVLAAVVCFLLLRFTIDMMSQQPVTPRPPATAGAPGWRTFS